MVAMIPGLIQGGIGLIQGIAGALSTPDGPKYQIPGAINDMMASARNQASQTRLPGQDKMEANMGNQMASYVNNMGKMGGGSPDAIGGLAKLYGQQLSAQNNLGVAAANYHAQNQQQLQNAQKMYGSYQDKQWGYNVDDPYQTKAATSSALIGSGISNFFQGGKDVSGVASYQNLLNKMFPKGGGGTNWTLGANGNGTNPLTTGQVQSMFTTSPANNFVTPPLNVGGNQFNANNGFNPWGN